MTHCFSGGHGGIPGQGYSYATIATSVTPVEGTDSRTLRSGTLSGLRRSSVGVNGRPIVDRRYSPPPRHRAGTNPTSQYASLPSGLTLPKTAVTKGAMTAATSQPGGNCHDKMKPHKLTSSKSKLASEMQSGRRKSKGKMMEEKNESRRQSLSSSRSKMTTKSRSGSVNGKKKSGTKSKNKSKSGWGCFG